MHMLKGQESTPLKLGSQELLDSSLLAFFFFSVVGRLFDLDYVVNESHVIWIC